MFVTYKEHKAPNPFGEGSHWRATELALQRPWFLVSISQTEGIDDDALRVSRTMLVSNISDVEGLAQMEVAPRLQLDSVFIITPGVFNGTSQWKMEPLRAVWKAEEPLQLGQLADIYETAEGMTYADSLLATPVNGFAQKVLHRTFPLQQ